MEEFEIPKPPRTNYINAEYGLKSWLLTRDHKRIALLYLGAISFFFFIGSLYAMAIRLELLTPAGVQELGQVMRRLAEIEDQTMLRATPQRTAEARRAAPTPNR